MYPAAPIRLARSALLAALAAPGAVIATPASEPPELTTGLAQMVFGLAVVVAILLASLWLIKRLSSPRGAAAGLKILGGAALGSRERIVLVEVADKVLVLGVCAANVNTLHTLDAEELRRHAAQSPDPATGNDFQKWLKASLERRKNAQ